MSDLTGGASGSNAPEPQQPAVGIGASERPWTVTSAVVIAFAFAALALLGSILLIVLAVQANTSQTNTIFLQVANIALAALLIWLGVLAWRGVNGRSLFIAAAVIVAVNIIWIIINVATGGARQNVWFGVVAVALSLAIIALLLQQASRQFLRSRGGRAI
jgi:hypothetical protein